MCAKSQLSIDVGKTYSNSGYIETDYTRQGWVYKSDTLYPQQSYVIQNVSSQITKKLGSNHYETITASNMANYATRNKIAQAYDSLIAQLNTEIAEVSEIRGKKGEERLQVLLEKRQNIQCEKDQLLSKYPTSSLYTSVRFDLAANATWDNWGMRTSRGYIQVSYNVDYIRILSNNELSELMKYWNFVINP